MALPNPSPLTGRSKRLCDQHFQIGKCTLGEQARNLMKVKTVKEKQRDVVLRHVCALLNSGGGVLSVEIENKDYDYDTMSLGLDMEEHLTKLLYPSVIEDFIKFTQYNNTLELFVKSWCPDGQRARLCSVDSGLRARSATSARSISSNAVLNFIRKKKERTEQPNLPQKAESFYNDGRAQLHQILEFGEGVNVEFKSFECDLKKKLEENLPKYLSAFANTEGGFLFIGVDDKSKKVVGCGQGMDRPKIEQMIQNICERAKARAVHFSDCAKNTNWSIDSKVFQVMNSSRFIIAVNVQAFCCAVFEDDPKCWHVEDGRITSLSPSSWLEKMQLSDPNHELVNRFQTVLSLENSPPQCRPVYSTQNIAKLQERIFPVHREEMNIKSESIPQELFGKYPNLLSHMSNNGPGILIMSTSWAVDINLQRNEAVICEGLLITAGNYPTLFSWVESSKLWQYASHTAFCLKQKLVNLGGYTGRLCVIPRLVDCQTGELIPNQTNDGPPYPESYKLGHDTDLVALLQSLTIVVLSFTSPLSDTLGCEFFNLLTEEQFSILHGYSGIKHLFIHGPPGSGKTLIAMEKIRMIQNSDSCENTDILYLCENVGLREFVRKQSLCLCETRAEFMMRTLEDLASIKHIVVDEGQNFQVENGVENRRWYKKAQSLVQGKHGFFWIFLDYFQRSHTIDDDLPPLVSQNIVCLSEVVRNSKDVFDVMSDLMGKIAHNSKPEKAKHLQSMRENMKLSYPFRGQHVTLTVRHVFAVEPEVVEIIRTLLKEGHSARDIAVLYPTTGLLNESGYSIKKEELPVQFGSVEEADQDKVVLDTVCRFSGLERNIVIVVDPFVCPSQYEIQLNVVLSAYSRARIRLYAFVIENIL